MRKGVLAVGLFCTLALIAQERSMQTFEKEEATIRWYKIIHIIIPEYILKQNEFIALED